MHDVVDAPFNNCVGVYYSTGCGGAVAYGGGFIGGGAVVSGPS